MRLHRELYKTGTFEIHIHPERNGAFDFLQKNCFIVINRDGNKSGIVRDFYISEARGKQEVVILGTTGDGMTRRRTVVPPTAAQVPGSLGWDRVRGNAETVIKHYAARHMTAPFDAVRRIDNLMLAENQHRGDTFPWQARFQYLHEVLENIGLFSNMGYFIHADVVNKRWVFDVIPGADRSQSQRVNDPVLFKMEYSNIEEYRYTEDRQNYRNTAYVGGRGEDENRLVFVLGAENRGLDRREVFIDCSGAENIDELIHQGSHRLAEYYEAKTVEVLALPRTFIFEQDYFLGDIVTVYISRLGLSLDTRITSVRETWERNTGHTIEARFGDRLPNIFTVLSQQEVVR